MINGNFDLTIKDLTDNGRSHIIHCTDTNSNIYIYIPPTEKNRNIVLEIKTNSKTVEYLVEKKMRLSILIKNHDENVADVQNRPLNFIENKMNVTFFKSIETIKKEHPNCRKFNLCISFKNINYERISVKTCQNTKTTERENSMDREKKYDSQSNIFTKSEKVIPDHHESQIKPTLKRNEIFSTEKVTNSTLKTPPYSQKANSVPISSSTIGPQSPTKISTEQKVTYPGLLNQGATCYMNSFLQALFHLPAFRRAVFLLPDKLLNQEPALYGLYDLFSKMQTSSKPVDTIQLTKTFGWDRAQLFRQNDAQEFSRILLDYVIESASDVDKRIGELFKGELTSFIRGDGVNNKKAEEFMDLSLDVNYESLELALAEYTSTELLTGENQYVMEDGRRIDAEIGTEITALPPVLQIHLQRLSYNIDFQCELLVTNKLEYPENLILGKDLYQLFGVVIHSGPANSGHFYAYLRPGMDKWLLFNDSVVLPVDKRLVLSDGVGGPESSRYAYLLYYVRSDAVNDVFCEVPDSLIRKVAKPDVVQQSGILRSFGMASERQVSSASKLDEPLKIKQSVRDEVRAAKKAEEEVEIKDKENEIKDKENEIKDKENRKTKIKTKDKESIVETEAINKAKTKGEVDVESNEKEDMNKETIAANESESDNEIILIEEEDYENENDNDKDEKDEKDGKDEKDNENDKDMIEFQLYSEDAFREAAAQGLAGICMNGGSAKKLRASRTADANQMALQATRVIGAKNVRLWRIEEGGRLCPISSSETADNLPNMLLAQAISVDEAVDIPEGMVSLFFKVYSTSSIHPLFYAGNLVIKCTNASFRPAYPLMKKRLMLDDMASFTLFVEDRECKELIKKAYEYAIMKELRNGGCIVLSTNSEIEPSIVASGVKIRENAQIAYEEVMLNKFPSSPVEYYKLRNFTVDLNVMMLNVPDSKPERLKVPASIDGKSLAQYYALIHGIDLNSNEDISAFEIDPQTSLPKCYPFRKITSRDICISITSSFYADRKLFIVVLMNGREFIDRIAIREPWDLMYAGVDKALQYQGVKVGTIASITNNNKFHSQKDSNYISTSSISYYLADLCKYEKFMVAQEAQLSDTEELKKVGNPFFFEVNGVTKKGKDLINSIAKIVGPNIRVYRIGSTHIHRILENDEITSWHSIYYYVCK